MTEWGGVGAAYEASYASLCAETGDDLSAAFGRAGGRSLLDVGAGTGRLAARLATDGWQVTACEPEASMREIVAREHPRLRVVDGGLPELPFGDDAFDVVTANFVLNHVDDPRRCAGELARVARHAVAATIWSRSPSWFWADVRDRAVIDVPAPEQLPPEKDFVRTADGFGVMLTEGGWASVDVHEKTWTWWVDPAALWLSAEGGVAGAGRLYRGLDAAERHRFRAAFDTLCAELVVDGLVPLEHTAAIAVGR
ncbi:hypothetical protein GCM10025768_12830 [Microbacterium pseudoresistens]|uniref:SAM-dependent methyltransferase n=1 Tax=Microbacterium pseudoresistens TaxID=640634 RepID=A0A7Y9EWN9_9MICO|nr:class I SAM-dependent methyltransferase [Microbacterium pseudoresistens]NYD55186.1 SAM-dependent methyltransferase [Microbacterium pseudoresistens]